MTAAHPATEPDANGLTGFSRVAVLVAAFLGLVFDGFELGLMPAAAHSE